jgi:uncharacterized protein (DUF362 family)/ferredoxin
MSRHTQQQQARAPGAKATVSCTVSAVKTAAYEPSEVAAAVHAALQPFTGSKRIFGPGSTILVKPNLLSPRPPAEAVTTHPSVVQAVVEYCFAAGASRVWIADSCAGDHADEVLWEATGMTAVAAATGAELKSFQGAKYAHPCGDAQVPVPSWFKEVTAWISVPKLKTHTLTVMTCTVKNSYGLIAGSAKALYHGRYPSPRTMSGFLLDVYRELRPDLVVVDAVEAMEGEGPSNGQPRPVGLILAGDDGVAVDSVCSRLFGRNPLDMPLLRTACKRGIGTVDAHRIQVQGNGTDILDSMRLRPSIGRWIQCIPEPLFKAATRILACQPKIIAGKCVACGACARICSQSAIKVDDHGDVYTVDAARCIMCMCCAEACPHHAVAVRSPLRVFNAVRRIAHRISRT